MGGPSFRQSRYEVIDLDVRRDGIGRRRLFAMVTILPNSFQVGVGGWRCHADAKMHRSSNSTRSDEAAVGNLTKEATEIYGRCHGVRLASQGRLRRGRGLVFLSLDDKAEELGTKTWLPAQLIFLSFSK